MQETIISRIDNLQLGNAQVYKNMAVVPLKGVQGNIEYLLFEEALQKGVKVSETGTVQQLNVTNQTGKDVLILQGEYIVGGKQNRMVSRTILLANGYQGSIPVNCVEQHRWTPNYRPVLDDRIGDFRPSMEMASRKASFAANRGQQEVWGAVYALADSLQVNTPTGDIGKIFEQRKNDIDDYLSHFQYESGTVGICVVTEQNGIMQFSVDVFDKASTMQKHFDKLIKSYAVDSIKGEGNSTLSDNDVRGFLQKIHQGKIIQREAISLGNDYRIENGGIEGSGLVHKNVPLYITYATRNDYGYDQKIDCPVIAFRTDIARRTH